MVVSSLPPGAHDFDFLHGSWRIANKRLVSRLTRCDEWERFDAAGTCRPILDGIGNIDDFRPASGGRQGFVGASIRIFNPATELWSIFWADNVLCDLTPPVIGHFVDGMGELFGDDMHDGTSVQVRFWWSDITTDALRWEQAFSTDGGANWETNWIMFFTRERSQ